jgi:hypothetical protein
LQCASANAFTIRQVLDKKEPPNVFTTSLPLDDSGETFPDYLAADETFPLKKN